MTGRYTSTARRRKARSGTSKTTTCIRRFAATATGSPDTPPVMCSTSKRPMPPAGTCMSPHSTGAGFHRRCGKIAEMSESNAIAGAQLVADDLVNAFGFRISIDAETDDRLGDSIAIRIPELGVEMGYRPTAGVAPESVACQL